MGYQRRVHGSLGLDPLVCATPIFRLQSSLFIEERGRSKCTKV